jgi:phosphoglucosamine mutase
VAVQFGTDGIRGRVGEQITDELAYQLGHAVATVFSSHTCFVGSDTRESSPVLLRAALAGLIDGGVTAVNLGVITTPGVAVTAQERSGVGMVISASHNPYYDNGLKVLGVGGAKLDLATEARVQEALDHAPLRSGPYAEVPVDEGAGAEYLARLVNILGANALSSMRVILDCANGAASHLAPELFRQLGASVEVLNASPDGRNINANCGSTHPEQLAARVRRSSADVGLAFDGDADRLIAVDSYGTIRDGDDLMILFARDLNDRGELGGALVVTSMSNLGLHHAMRESQIELIQTDLGDRNVFMALEERDLPLGGEQSGHLIFRRLSPTGDGMLSAVLLCDLIQRQGRLRELATAAWHRSPQRLLSIANDKFDPAVVDQVKHALVSQYSLNDSQYRLLVRPSGTEPVVRVMIEAANEEFVTQFVSQIAVGCGVSI